MKKYYWFFIFILCVFLSCLSTNYDYDFWARIIVGERFVEQGILPYEDFLSYTPTHIWFDHEYGAGIVFYLILKYLKSFGIILFQALMMFAVSFCITKIQTLKKHSFPLSIFSTAFFIGCFYFLNDSLIRCQLFSFLFFSIFLYILEKNRKSPTPLVWGLPFFTIIWNNLHGGVVAGLGIIFIYILGAIIEKKPFKKLFVILVLSVLLLIINPYGIKYLSFLFMAATMTRKYVVEWWSPFNPYHFVNYFLVCAYLLFGLFSIMYNSFKTKKYEYTKIIAIIITIAEGFLHVKLLSLALITVTALAYNEMFIMLLPLKKYLTYIEKSLYVVIIVFGITIPLYSPQIPRADYTKYPLKEVEFLKINNIKGNIVPYFGHGSYVSYKLYPNNLIFMDGRYEEVYNNKEFLTLRDYELAEPNWQDILINYNTEILMPMKTADIYKILLNNNNWVLIYEGNLCGIFVKKENAKKIYLEPNTNILYYRKNIFKRQ